MLKLVTGAGLAVVVALMIAGCSKSNSTGPGGNAPQLVSPTFTGPTSTSATTDTSSGYIYANTYASIFGLYDASFTAFFVGTGTQSGNTWSWTYTDPESHVTGKWSATSSSSGYNWSLVYSGGPYTGNFTALSGSESTDGKTGDWSIFWDNTTHKEFEVSWTTDGSSNLTGTITTYDSSGVTALQKDVVTNNKDKSGELKEWAGTQLTWDVIWNADGSGHYTEWDDQGNIVATGSWLKS